MLRVFNEWLTTRKVNRLIAALDSPKTRGVAAKELGKLRDPRAVVPLADALRSAMSNDKQAIITALDAFRDPRATEVLLAGYEQYDGPINSAITQALLRIGPRALDTLIGELKAKKIQSTLGERATIQFQCFVASLIGKLGGQSTERAVTALTPLLKNTAHAVRSTVAEALGKLGNPMAVGPLAEMLCTDHKEQIAAYSALRTLGWQPVSSKERAAAAVAAGDYISAATEGVVALPFLEAAFNFNDESRLRVKIVIAVRKVDANRSVRLLMEMLRCGEHWKAVADSALEFRDDRVVEAMIATLKDPRWQTRWNATAVLEKLADPRAVEPLVMVLVKDSDSDVRRRAAEALRQLGDQNALNALMNQLRSATANHEAVLTGIEALGWEPQNAEDKELLAAARFRVHLRELTRRISTGSSMAESAAGELETMLQTRVHEITRDELEALTRVPAKVTWEEIEHIDDYSSEARFGTHSFDNKHVIRLAAEELSRRDSANKN